MKRVHLELNSAVHHCHLVVIDEPGGACLLPFHSSRTLQLFLTHLADSKQYKVSLNDDEWACLHTLTLSERRLPAAPTIPAHEAFIRQVTGLAWGSLPLSRKRQRLLSLYRPLLPSASLHVLARLSSDVLVARVKAETTPSAPPVQAA